MFRASRHQSHSLENGRHGFCRNFSKHRRLGELRRMFPQASKKMLAQQLREMERDALLNVRNVNGPDGTIIPVIPINFFFVAVHHGDKWLIEDGRARISHLRRLIG